MAESVVHPQHEPTELSEYLADMKYTDTYRDHVTQGLQLLSHLATIAPSVAGFGEALQQVRWTASSVVSHQRSTCTTVMQRTLSTVLRWPICTLFQIRNAPHACVHPPCIQCTRGPCTYTLFMTQFSVQDAMFPEVTSDVCVLAMMTLAGPERAMCLEAARTPWVNETELRSWMALVDWVLMTLRNTHSWAGAGSKRALTRAVDGILRWVVDCLRVLHCVMGHECFNNVADIRMVDVACLDGHAAHSSSLCIVGWWGCRPIVFDRPFDLTFDRLFFVSFDPSFNQTQAP